MKISIVSPVYQAEGCLEELVSRLSKTLPKITKDFEIILVNDASPDKSWLKIQELAKANKKIKALNLSRNFGQHLAITAGLDQAKGDLVVVMDCDLQDPPEDIPTLYKEINKGYDVVFGIRAKRKDGLIKIITSKTFYLFYNYFTENKFDNRVANFSISKKIVIDNFNKFREHSRSFPLFIEWMGFSVSAVNVNHAKRHQGKSSYSLRKMLSLGVDSVVSQSNKPLMLFVSLGGFLSLFSIIYAIYLIVRYYVYQVSVQGWTSLMVSLFFIAGLLLANMGVLGLYIGKIFSEVKNRPLYIVKDSIRIEDRRKVDNS